MLESEFSAFILTLPVIIIGGLLSYFTMNQLAKPSISKVSCFLLFFGLLVITPIIWVAQENYAYMHYSTFNTSPQYSYQINMYDLKGEPKRNDKNGISVYLFWSASCSKCKDEFPYFSDLALKYKIRDDINFYAVFVQFKASDSAYLIKETANKYEFEWSIIPEGQHIYDSLIQQGFPHLTIIDQDNKLLYNGIVCNRPWVYVNHPDRFFN
ncbi:MAG: hypothetical protein K0B15_03640 [Lentimicrobium sp.]|nr:hypothetical protein [Lentimicrobium sp.]